MEVTFIGVGSGSDGKYISTSIIVKSKKERILLGCGYSVVQPFLKKYGKTLNGIYVPNVSMSSMLGLAPLLKKLEGSTYVIGQKGVEGIVQDGVEDIVQESVEEIGQESVEEIFQKGVEEIVKSTIANYEPGSNYEFNLKEVEPGDDFTLGHFKLTFAYTDYFIKNMAVRIDDGKSVLCFSGDGNFTEESRDLYFGADLLIHEAYNLDEKTHNHSNIVDVLEMAKSNWVKKLALVSLRGDLREKHLRKVQKEIDKAKISRMKVILPTPDYITLI